MSKVNVAVIAGLLALAAVLGTMAATQTVALGTAQKQKADVVVQTRAKQLEAYQASLQRALAKKPPALPAVQPAAPAAAAAARRLSPSARDRGREAHASRRRRRHEAQGNDGGGDG